MKVEIIETKKNFEPIEIKLVIESEEQLCDLWHRLNISEKQLTYDYKESSTNSLKHQLSGRFWSREWGCLDTIVEYLKLTK